MLTAYVAGCVVAALFYGYHTPRSRDTGLAEMLRSFLFVAGWPIILTLALGHGFRIFSASKTAEDMAHP